MKHELPQLPYSFSDLEPFIDAQTMEIHYTKHHQGYVNKLNAALANYPEWQEKNLEELLRSLPDLPAEIETAVKNNGGGHYNHSLFWPSLAKPGQDGVGGEPSGQIGEIIKANFGDFNGFKSQFNQTAATLFGSGWAWLVKNGEKLEIIQTQNQDTPISQGFAPLLGLDVWEHAYYLKYQNRRADYIEAWWNIVNWNEVDSRLRQFA